MFGTLPRAGLVAAAAAALALGSVPGNASPARAAASAGTAATPHWASIASARIHPGSSVVIAGTPCVAGFVLRSGHRVFLTVPASCTGVSSGKPTDGCSEAQVPGGTPVTIRGARHPGTIVYSSFTQMQLHGETRPNRCQNNSLSLILLDRRDIRRTNPSVPVLGGPTGVATSAPPRGAQLYAYIKSSTTAVATKSQASGWAQQMVPAASAGTSDIGSPVLTQTGKALGMVTIVQQTNAGPSTVSRLDHELRYLRRTHGFHHVHLVSGTASYKPPAL